MYGSSLGQLKQKWHEIKNRTAWRRAVQSKVQPSGLTSTVHHIAREQGIKKTLNAHTHTPTLPCMHTRIHRHTAMCVYLFVVFLPLTLPVHLFWHDKQTRLPPFFGLFCCILNNHIFSVRHARIFHKPHKISWVKVSVCTSLECPVEN